MCVCVCVCVILEWNESQWVYFHGLEVCFQIGEFFLDHHGQRGIIRRGDVAVGDEETLEVGRRAGDGGTLQRCVERRDGERHLRLRPQRRRRERAPAPHGRVARVQQHFTFPLQAEAVAGGNRQPDRRVHVPAVKMIQPSEILHSVGLIDLNWMSVLSTSPPSSQPDIVPPPFSPLPSPLSLSLSPPKSIHQYKSFKNQKINSINLIINFIIDLKLM